MKTSGLAASDVRLLEAFADLLMVAGRDRAADALYFAIEAEDRRPELRLVHSAD